MEELTRCQHPPGAVENVFSQGGAKLGEVCRHCGYQWYGRKLRLLELRRKRELGIPCTECGRVFSPSGAVSTRHCCSRACARARRNRLRRKKKG